MPTNRTTTARRPASRADHERWLLELTSLPTAAGREDRVVAWISRWVAARRDLRLRRDPHGNLLVEQTRSGPKGIDRVWFQAHLDHPAFVVRSIDGRELELEFRGGVHDQYFVGAALEVIDGRDRSFSARITALDAAAKPFKLVRAKLAKAATSLAIGDIARWKLPKPAIVKGHVRTHACDDLAAVAAALAAFDRVRTLPECGHVGLFFTLAEEIGFVGTIGAARSGSVGAKDRIVCLENSRSFAESPIGGGAIVRVGDRRSVFSPELTNRIGDVVLAHQKKHPDFVFQRKLMAGGSCEATAFAAYGFRSTCLCLPLGNYHNMVDIDGVLAGRTKAKVGPEFVAVSDFHGLVAMLVLIAESLDSAEVPPTRDTMETLWKDLRFVLEGAGAR
jgi:endoglucanase